MKKLLIAGHTLNHINGIVTWTHTISKEFYKRGWRVDQLVFHECDLNHHFEEFGNVYVGPNWKYKEFRFCEDEYDLAIVHFNWLLDVLDIDCPKIFVSHGIFSDWDTPVEGFELYVDISEATQIRTKDIGFSSIVINNPIDTDRFVPKLDLREHPKVFSMCRSDVSNQLLKLACDDLELELVIHQGQRTWDIESKWEDFDIVVGIGRSIYEAMSCGKAVIVFDQRKIYYKTEEYSVNKWGKDTKKGYLTYADGIVTKNNAYKICKEYNASGRAIANDWNSHIPILEEMQKYDNSMGSFNRKFILENNSVTSAVDMLLDNVDV